MARLAAAPAAAPRAAVITRRVAARRCTEDGEPGMKRPGGDMRGGIIEEVREGTLWHAPPSSPTCFGQSDDEVRERYWAKRGQLDEDLVKEFGEEVLQGGRGGRQSGRG